MHSLIASYLPIFYRGLVRQIYSLPNKYYLPFSLIKFDFLLLYSLLDVKLINLQFDNFKILIKSEKN